MSRWSDEMRKRYPDKSQAAEILADALANLNLGFESLNPKVPSFYTKDYVGTGTSISS